MKFLMSNGVTLYCLVYKSESEFFPAAYQFFSIYNYLPRLMKKIRRREGMKMKGKVRASIRAAKVMMKRLALIMMTVMTLTRRRAKLQEKMRPIIKEIKENELHTTWTMLQEKQKKVCHKRMNMAVTFPNFAALKVPCLSM